MENIVLTESQQKLHDNIVEAYNDNSNHVCLVTGSAGSGKSTSVFKALDTIIKENPHASISFIAPTHNAVGVVRRIGDQWETLGSIMEYSTVASALKLKQKRIGAKTTFVQSQDPDWWSEIYLVDETSMIDQQTMDMLLDAGKRTRLVIFLGDKCQLPPISNDPRIKESPVFNWNGFRSSTNLTEVVRYSGDVLQVADKVRQNMEVGYVDLLKIIPEESETISTITMKQIKEEFAKTIAEGMNAKVLAYRNSTVDAVNTAIHSYLGHKDYFVEGCRIVNLNPITVGGRMIPIETPLTIDSISEDSINLGVLHKELSDLSIEYTLISASYYDDKAEVTFNALNLNQSIKFADIKKIIVKRAKDNPSIWRAFYHLDDNYIPCRLPYATTVHKSQGNTYDEVIMVYNDFAYCRDFLTYNKLIYTSFTRTSGKVLIAV